MEKLKTEYMALKDFEERGEFIYRLHGSKYFTDFMLWTYGNERRQPIYFITINPDQSKIKFEVFKFLVFKLLRRSMFRNTVMTFEQRGKEMKDIGKGFHCHIISEKRPNLSPAQVQKNIYSSLKNYVGNIKHIDVRVYNGDLRDDKIAYLKGDKWDAEKEEAVRLNKIWRVTKDLQSIYYIDINGKVGNGSCETADEGSEDKASI